MVTYTFPLTFYKLTEQIVNVDVLYIIWFIFDL